MVFWRILQGFQKSDGKVGLYVLIIRSVKTAEQIQELADLANKIWNEYFVKILSKEQIAYMVEQFQSNAALTKQIEEGYQYYFVIDDTEVIGYLEFARSQMIRCSYRSSICPANIVEKDMRPRCSSSSRKRHWNSDAAISG